MQYNGLQQYQHGVDKCKQLIINNIALIPKSRLAFGCGKIAFSLTIRKGGGTIGGGITASIDNAHL